MIQRISTSSDSVSEFVFGVIGSRSMVHDQEGIAAPRASPVQQAAPWRLARVSAVQRSRRARGWAASANDRECGLRRHLLPPYLLTYEPASYRSVLNIG